MARPADARRYSFAGAAAGLIHSLIGLALRLFLGTNTGALGDVGEVILVLGGFLLTSAQAATAWSALPATVAAGALSGMIYARLTRPVRSAGS